MNKYIIKTISWLFGAMAAVSCTGSFEDVNKDPDNPLASEVPSINILAYCERYASEKLFNHWFDLNESCGFSGQIAKLTYTQEGYYNFRPIKNNGCWEDCDNVLSNLKDIIDRETTESNIGAVATIFLCQMWQIKSDRWGNIPYWTTTQGSSLKNEAYQLESGITTPAFDKQSDIYPDLLARLEKAVSILVSSKANDDIDSGDGLLNGDISSWAKYGNALRLRIATRIANVAPELAKKTIEAVAADTENLPASNEDNVFFNWTAEYPEPWANYYISRQNEYGVSELMINTLQDVLKDPRLQVYATPIRADHHSYVGYPIGTKANALVQNFSQIGERFQNHSGVTGFSPWLRSCEVYFQLAYAATKGWNVGMSQQEAYSKAVTLSLQENGINQDAIDAYIASDAVKTATTDNIFTQWWISLYKNGQEAWSVYRMAPTDTYLFKNNKIAVDSFYPNHNCPPLAYTYPDTERNLNSANCGAEASAEVDHFWGKKMWWDTREGVK